MKTKALLNSQYCSWMRINLLLIFLFLVVVNSSFAQSEYDLEGIEIDSESESPSRVIIHDEHIVVGFGQQKKESVVGSIVQTSSETLEQSGGLSNLRQALIGNSPGVFTTTSIGKPGEENPDIVIRGVSTWHKNGPLILVDGIERPMKGIDLNSVATISVLKDASATAVYGVRGANGVILITTKRGEEGKAKININASTTLKSYSKSSKLLDPSAALTLKSRRIDNGIGYFPEQSIFNSYNEIADKNGSNVGLFYSGPYPYRDWDEVIKDVATSYNANINVSGGTKSIKYFGSLDYIHEGDIYKSLEYAYGYPASFGYDRLNVRSNLDFSLTKSTMLRVNLSGSHAVSKGTNFFAYENLLSSYIYDVASDAVDPLYSNGGSNNSQDRFNTDFVIEQDLGFLLKGLSLNGLLSFDKTFDKHSRRIVNSNGDEWEDVLFAWESIYTGPNDENTYDYPSSTVSTERVKSNYRRLNYLTQINYGNTFGYHSVGAMAYFGREDYEFRDQLSFSRENWAFRATYDYNKRYLLEYNGAYNGSEFFLSDYKFAFFQSGALGWVVTEEPFMKNLKAAWLDMLKLRTSYGKTGDDNIEGRWMHTDVLAFIQSISGGNSSKTTYPWYNGKPNLQWEVSTKFDIAADYVLFGSVISGSFGYFTENRTNILLTRSSELSPILGGYKYTLTAFLGEVDTKGYEIEVRWNKPLGQDWRLWGNVFFTRAAIKIVEIDNPYSNSEYSGKLLENYGFYKTWDEIFGSTNYDAFNEAIFPGGNFITDYNSEDIFSDYFNMPYGFKSVPKNIINSQFGVDYKGWSFFVQLYGIENVLKNVNLSNFSVDKDSPNEDESPWWDPKNNNIDISPLRFGAIKGSQTNTVSSSPYFLDSSYFCLKFAELSYTFKREGWLSRTGLSNLKVFANGDNLFLWEKKPANRRSNTSGRVVYPLQRRFSLGLRISL